MRTVDIIQTTPTPHRKQFLVGESHDEGIFGVRSQHDTLPEAWNAAKAFSERFNVPVGIVSNLVAEQIVTLGLADSTESITRHD